MNEHNDDVVLMFNDLVRHQNVFLKNDTKELAQRSIKAVKKVDMDCNATLERLETSLTNEQEEERRPSFLDEEIPNSNFHDKDIEAFMETLRSSAPGIEITKRAINFCGAAAAHLKALYHRSLAAEYDKMKNNLLSLDTERDPIEDRISILSKTFDEYFIEVKGKMATTMLRYKQTSNGGNFQQFKFFHVDENDYPTPEDPSRPPLVILEKNKAHKRLMIDWKNANVPYFHNKNVIFGLENYPIWDALSPSTRKPRNETMIGGRFILPLAKCCVFCYCCRVPECRFFCPYRSSVNHHTTREHKIKLCEFTKIKRKLPDESDEENIQAGNTSPMDEL